jgi:hypothetical protein
MSQKNFWQEKWLKDQFNERNAGQRNDPDKPKPAPEPEASSPNPDDVLRVMLNTPPKPHKAPGAVPKKPKARAPKKRD